MDKKFLLEHNLMEAHNQFMRLCNEGYISTSMNEAGDEEMPQDGPQQPPMDGQEPNAGGMPPMGPDNGQQQPPMGGPNDAPPMGPDAPGGQPPMDGQDPNAGGMPPMGPGDDMPPMGPDGPMDDDEPQEDDEVLDVEELTQAQEKLNKKENMVGQDLGKLDSRISNLLTAVEKMQGVIDHNNSEITALKAELQKRMPTQKERLNMRSLDSYPFNISPDDYWKQKESEGVYQAQYDNNQPETKEYTITNQDVDDYSDSDIENSFDDLHQTMKDIFKNW